MLGEFSKQIDLSLCTWQYVLMSKGTRSAIIDVVNRTKAERQELADVDSALVFGIEFDCLEKFAGRARFRRAHRSLCAGPWRQGLRKSSSPVQVRTQI
jgi:hypothetical protein